MAEENKKNDPEELQDIEDEEDDEEEPERGFWGKLIRSPFFWIIALIVALISFLNYCQRFTNIEIHNQYKIF